MYDWCERCLQAYSEYCAETGETTTDEERQAWVDEWRDLEADDYEDAVEAYLAEQRRYFRDGV